MIELKLTSDEAESLREAIRTVVHVYQDDLDQEEDTEVRAGIRLAMSDIRRISSQLATAVNFRTPSNI